MVEGQLRDSTRSIPVFYDHDTDLYQREYLQGVRTIMRSDSVCPLDCGLPWPDGPDGRKPQRFTNTAVPRFDGTGCWQQHLLVFQAIMKLNGWSPDTAALQLFAHLDGEALQVALLLPDKIRDRWKDLVDTLSAYYKTPGKLVVFRRKFENAHRRPGSDPATFAKTLGMLALRGFSDMKEKARDLMVRNKFIASQQSCDLRRHLDSASCRIWESHAEPIAIIHRCQDTEYRKPKLLMPPSATDSLGFTVGSAMPTSDESTRRGSHSSADWELLIRNALETVATRRDIISGWRRNTELEQLLQDATLVGLVMIQGTSPPASLPGGGGGCLRMDDWEDSDRCFSCGLFGHGVNRCTRLDRYFPFKRPGCSVDVQDGQYRASRIRRDEQDLWWGKEGWFGREGQPPGPSAKITHLTQVGSSAGMETAER